MANIVTVNLTEADKKFLDENKDLSPTKLLRDKIEEVRQDYKIDPSTIKELNRKIKTWAMLADKQRQYIEGKGLIEDFMNSQKNPFK